MSRSVCKANLHTGLDTNLFVRSFITPTSYSRLLIQSWYEDVFILLMSEDIYNEITDVLSRPHLQRYQLTQERVKVFLLEIESKCLFVDPYPVPVQSRDAKDTKILQVAVAGRADYLVSADNDLLTLKGHPGLGNVQIVTAEEMLAVL